jgi:PAS domain S-box-containing protein
MADRQKILVIDQEREGLDAVAEILKDVDADIFQAESGNEAVAATLHGKFALVILAARMSGMDSYQLAGRLRKGERTGGIPIIFVADGPAEKIKEYNGDDGGGIDYIYKPLHPGTMIRKVKNFLELSRCREDLWRYRDHLGALVAERTADLKGRVKEIQCIYAVSSLASDPLVSIDEMLERAVGLIPPGWQYPDITCVRILFEGREFKTANFRQTPWRLFAPIPPKDSSPDLRTLPSSVEVCYLEERAHGVKGPFLNEEIRLVSEIASRLGVMIETKRTEDREKHLNIVLRSIRSINQLIVHENRRDRLIRKVCDNLVSSRGFQAAWIVLTDGAFSKDDFACAGLKCSHMETLAGIFQSGGLPMCCQAWNFKDGVFMIENVSATCKRCPLADSCRGNSAITLKLVYQGKTYGWMGVSFPAKFSLDPEETSLLSETAGDIAFAINGMNVATEHEKVEADLRESENRFQALFEGAVEGILVTDLGSHLYKYANPAICQMLGYSREELLQMGAKDLHPEEVMSEVAAAVDQNFKGEFKAAYGLKCLRKDGETIHVDIHPTKIDVDGRVCLLSFFSDVTEKRQLGREKKDLELQLQQAQKMEALGQLAGGVAHDYNNMIGIILGYGDLVLSKMDADDPMRENVQEIVSAAMRSRDITLQLLAFARQQRVNPRVLDLNDAVEGVFKMLQRVLGESINLTWQPGDGLWPVYLDPPQLVQILTNLCSNARDAIEDVGSISIVTKNCLLEGTYTDGSVETVPGEFVTLSVCDDGSGMDGKTVKNIFDPFFTTKEVGKGTGLGLSTVYGIVKQNNGFIDVHSDIGKGTTFSIHFPRFMGSVTQSIGDKKAAFPRSMGETVLVVEDEEQYLDLIETLLVQLDYTVLVASSPGEALRQARMCQDGIDLLITDVVMPEMNGRELGERVLSIHPGCSIIYISGYTSDAVAARGINEEKDCFLRKPFILSVLANKVKAILSGAEAQAPDRDDPPREISI